MHHPLSFVVANQATTQQKKMKKSLELIIDVTFPFVEESSYTCYYRLTNKL